SYATACNECVPSLTEAESHPHEYGYDPSDATTTPSTNKSTSVTPTLSDAAAHADTTPDNDDPATGAPNDTTGAEPAFATVTDTDALRPTFPAASYATACNECVPSLTEAESHRHEYGYDPSDATTTPSTNKSTS